MEQEDIDRILALVDKSELNDVQYHELHVKRSAVNSAEVRAEDEPEDSTDSTNGTFGVRPQFRFDEESFGFRLVGEITSPVGEVRVSVAGEYALLDGAPELDRKLVKMFGNQVGVMALYPFLRESIATLTAKAFGTPVFVPLIERGDVEFEMDEEPVDADGPEGAVDR